MTHSSDFLIIGGGIIGMTIAQTLRTQNPNASIIIIEKEPTLAFHASGRNSGVLHAGFYYSADSLKAKFCREGNLAMRRYCEENKLPITYNKKLVIAQNADEVEGLRELKRRGDVNQVETHLIDEQEAEKLEPNVRTHKLALFSPNTATVEPGIICAHLAKRLQEQNVKIHTDTPFRRRLRGNQILAGHTRYDAGKIINCAGLYADKIAQQFGFSDAYTIMPFKGVYLKYHGAQPPLRMNIYPVPNLKNPFLGVHFTITAKGEVKIGPTAMPAFWREQYQGCERFNATEAAQIIGWQSKLMTSNAFGFRQLALEEIKKYRKSYLLNQAANLVKQLNTGDQESWQWSKPGIRAQLLNKNSLSLVQDFVVEGDKESTHVLNAVSPAFTCSWPFAEWVVGGDNEH